MATRRCGPRENLKLRDYQEELVREILNKLKEGKRNIFLSLPQGTGKTIIALAALSELINENDLESVLVLLPRRVLVDQWVDRAQEFFYGLDLMKNPTLSKMSIEKIRGWLKHSGAVGIAMTCQSFRNYIKKGYFSEEDFDMVIVDEAADLVVARDFIEGFRMSAFLTGLEKWKKPKILILPYHVSQKKIRRMMRKFGKQSHLIRRYISISQFLCTVNDPIIVKDPLINIFVTALEERYKRIRTNVNRILNKYGIEGYRENLETLLNPITLERLKKIYRLDDETLQQIQTMIAKYILIQHVKKWFLYSNREELSRSILASQKDVEKWLKHEDKKLLMLEKVVRSYLARNCKVYIFSQYIATAQLIADFLLKRLRLKLRDVVLITGLDEDQYVKLDSFKRAGRILVTTPVFDKGTDIPQADAIIIYTPPMSTEKLLQVVGRIRGGEITLLAYEGYEEEIINQVADKLRQAFAKVKSRW